MSDTFLTIEAPCEGQFTEKRSKFLAFAFPISSVDEVKTLVDEFRKKYYDARHVCWAYMLGVEMTTFRANDDGEPSGTAGKPILGQIKSFGLTNVLVLVVRYFGGVKLGTGGLTVAYRQATAECLSVANIVEKTVNEVLTFTFVYEAMNSVMKILKDFDLRIISQHFDNDCRMLVEIRKTHYQGLLARLQKVDSLQIED